MRTQAPPGALPTVLLVERNGSLRHLLDTLLTEQGYRVLEAGTRAEVLEHLRAELRIDVVVADTGIALPGWEVAQEVCWQRPGVPVVRLIESAADALPIYGEDPATMTLIQKPFAITELLSAIDQLACWGVTLPASSAASASQSASGKRLGWWRRRVPHLVLLKGD